MFDEQNKNSGVEDILATTEAPVAPVAQPLGPPTALAQGKLQPAQPGTAKPPVPAEQLSGAKGKGFPIKKILAFVIVFLVVGSGAAAGYFWWQGRSQALAPVVPLGQPNSEGSVTAPPAENNTTDNPINQAVDQFQQKAIDQVVDPFTKPAPSNNAPSATPTMDTDQDGLSDVDEQAHGTNINLVDTDGDGLSDWEEVTVFGTNPLDPDTDADTYPDGSEVQKGYNPKGSGKLLDFEQAKSVTQ